MKDELGDRMKEQYENRTRFSLPRRTYAIIRLDGKAFHTYTRGLNKPFDKELYEDIDNAIIALMREVQGVQFAYTQSDEISLLLTDFALPTTSAWFDNNIQKMVSVAASIMTAEFNKLRIKRLSGMLLHNYDPNYVTAVQRYDASVQDLTMAYFDGRTFTIPDRIEVMNYFIHRNQDCARNAVSMVAQSHFSNKQLHGMSTTDMIEMLRKEKDVEWLYYPNDLRFGRMIVKETYKVDFVAGPDGCQINQPCERTRWISMPAWKFTEAKEQLLEFIPEYS
jgi:tRNA(His) guanylyltransferase